MGEASIVRGQSLGDWTRDREPPAPEGLIRRMGDGERVPDELDGAVEALVGAARSALADAAASRGERKGAFRLLEADAFLTYACEVALDAQDPSPLLAGVLDAVVAEAEEG